MISKASVGSAPNAAGVGERTDQVVELVHRPRPAMDEQQREGRRPAAADVVVVKVEAIDLVEELGVAVQVGFVATPIVLRTPVVAERAHVVDVGAVVPAGAGESVGPARTVEALAQVIEDGVGDGDLEGTWHGLNLTPLAEVTDGGDGGRARREGRWRREGARARP